MLIGSLPRQRRGFTLIELMIGLVIVGLALALGMPGYFEWLQNAQIRAASETTLSGVQLAHLEALKQNKSIRFQLMTSLDAGCALSTSASNWVVSREDASGACDEHDREITPFIIDMKAGNEGSKNVTVDASQDTIVFNALGQATIDAAATDPITIDITNTNNGGTCVKDGGKRRCLRIEVTRDGLARMCDPAVSDTDDPRKCS